MRKEEILIGTREELEDYYYKELNVKPRDLSNPIGNLEFCSLPKQIESLSEKGFGMIIWLEAKTSPTVEGNIDLILRKSFVWIHEGLPEELRKELYS